MEDTWLKKRLDNAGLRLTNPRETTLNILKEADKHLSAEDIYVEAHKKNRSIGLTSIYRTLDLFTEINLVQKFDFGDGKARYELIFNREKEKHHHHLICLGCNTVIEYSDFISEETELMKRTEETLQQKYHFTITHHIIHFYGLCEKCKKRKEVL